MDMGGLLAGQALLPFQCLDYTDGMNLLFRHRSAELCLHMCDSGAENVHAVATEESIRNDSQS